MTRNVAAANFEISEEVPSSQRVWGILHDACQFSNDKSIELKRVHETTGTVKQVQKTVSLFAAPRTLESK